MVFFTKEALLRYIRADYELLIVDPTTTFRCEKFGRSTQVSQADGQSYVVFRPDDLTDEEIFYLLTRPYGGYISVVGDMDELAKAFGFSTENIFHEIKEINVKE